MRVVGDFSIASFDEIVKNKQKILRLSNEAIKRQFVYAVGAMLVEIGKNIPFLTGTTRQEVAKLLQDVDNQIRALNGRKSFKSKLPLKTTLRKTAKGTRPRYSSNLYAIAYTRTYRKGWGQIKSRGEWRDYLEQMGDNEADSKIAFPGMMIEGSNKVEFIFRLDVPHWERYDRGTVPGKPPKGPWNVLDDGLKAFNKAFDNGIPVALQDITDVFTKDANAAITRLEQV